MSVCVHACVRSCVRFWCEYGCSCTSMFSCVPACVTRALCTASGYLWRHISTVCVCACVREFFVRVCMFLHEYVCLCACVRKRVPFEPCTASGYLWIHISARASGDGRTHTPRPASHQRSSAFITSGTEYLHGCCCDSARRQGVPSVGTEQLMETTVYVPEPYAG